MKRLNIDARKYLSRLKPCCRGLPQRYVGAVLLTFGVSMMVMLRQSFSVALTQMAFIEEEVDYEDGENEDEQCFREELAKAEENKTEFDWGPSEKGLILSSYFYGYIIGNFIGGILTVQYGGKAVLNTGLFLSSIFCLLTPVSARTHYWLLFCIRLAIGLCHGVIYPAVTCVVAMWCPPNERSRMIAIIYSGVAIGSASGTGLTGLILGSMPGWDPVFYIFGSVTILWCALFHFFGYASPDQHPFVTNKERAMVEKSIAVTSGEKLKMIPWFQIFSSMEVIVLILISFAHSWVLILLASEMPAYFKHVLKFNIEKTGIRLALPSLSMLISSLSLGFISDWTITHKYMSVTTNRRIFGVLSNVLPIPFLIGVSYAGCDKTIASTLFLLVMFLKGLAYFSIKANPVDLSPNYAGVLIGVANGFGSLGGLLIPSLVSMFVIRDEGTITDWRKMFYFSSGILLLFTVPYGFFGSGDVQPWNHKNDYLED